MDIRVGGGHGRGVRGHRRRSTGRAAIARGRNSWGRNGWYAHNVGGLPQQRSVRAARLVRSTSSSCGIGGGAPPPPKFGSAAIISVAPSASAVAHHVRACSLFVELACMTARGP